VLICVTEQLEGIAGSGLNAQRWKAPSYTIRGVEQVSKSDQQQMLL
jgi:hypothetical protein